MWALSFYLACLGSTVHSLCLLKLYSFVIGSGVSWVVWCYLFFVWPLYFDPYSNYDLNLSVEWVI